MTQQALTLVNQFDELSSKLKAEKQPSARLLLQLKLDAVEAQIRQLLQKGKFYV